VWRIDGRAVLLGLRQWTTRQTVVAAAVAVLAIGLTGVGLLWRLQGRVVCPVPQRTGTRA